MVDRLYIAVDESGTVTSHEQFEVAGCWYVSEKRPRAALNETQNSTQDLLESCNHLPSGKSEIKGKDLGTDGLDCLFQSLCQFAHRDATVLGGRFPSDSRPIRYSFHGTNPVLARRALGGVEHETSTEESIRTMLLLSVLNPILYHDRFGEIRADEITVLLDSEVWKGPKEKIASTERVSSLPLQFEIWDSEKAPGIQFADVAANALFKEHSGRDFNGTHEKLDDLSL
jgi:hypothetical protein